MAQLAIRGHETRGKEVIEILEILGGKNVENYEGYNIHRYYFIKDNWIDWCHEFTPESDFITCTLEEFLTKFPYKVEDKVQHKGATSCGSIFVIEKMQWVDSDIEYTIRNLWNINYRTTVKAEDLQPYKEETMEGVYAYNEINCYHQDFGDKVRIRLGNDFEIKVEDKITYIVKKQPQYPKNYEECCDVLGIDAQFCMKYLPHGTLSYKDTIIYNLQALLICRDAYWKIAGEQMGLGKPWEPDYNEESYEQGSPIKYVIYYTGTHITKGRKCTPSCILAFPVEEMRDAFYENFKDTIKQCKELL